MDNIINIITAKEASEQSKKTANSTAINNVYNKSMSEIMAKIRTQSENNITPLVKYRISCISEKVYIEVKNKIIKDLTDLGYHVSMTSDINNQEELIINWSLI